MQQYRTALHHLNMALDVMLERGDTMMIANIIHPIHLCEVAIQEEQREIIGRNGGIDSTRDDEASYF